VARTQHGEERSDETIREKRTRHRRNGRGDLLPRPGGSECGRRRHTGADAGNNIEQTNDSEGGGGGLNGNLSEAEAKNVDVTEVTTNVTGGNGGTNSATINTGVVAGGGTDMVTTSEAPSGGGGVDVNFHSGDVAVTQEANGGDVNGSGNVSVAGGGNQTATATNNVDQSNTSEGDEHGRPGGDWNGGSPALSGPMGGGGPHDDGNVNLNGSSAEATNIHVVDVDTYITGGDGGYNSAEINTGIILGRYDSAPVGLARVNDPREDQDGIDVWFRSGDVWLRQEANGGDVNHSGNVHVTGGGNQTATATNNVSQSNASKEDGHDWKGGGDWNGDKSRSLGPNHDNGGNVNLNGSSAEATNIHKVEVETNVTGGNGGSNYADINTGIIGNTFYCPEYSTCTFNFHTGDVTVHQSANGGDVNGSGNVNIGGNGSDHASKPADCPKHENARPAVKPAASAPVAHKAAPVLSSAQPSGALAFTGSDVSLPLTVGLIALGLGVGLTAAGRRREIQTV